MGKFIIKAGNSNKIYFVLKSNNGQIVLQSQGYSSKTACIRGINSVKTNAVVDVNYEKKESGDGKYYFNLIAANGEVIGTSETYESFSGRDKGIESVKSNAPKAHIEEEI